MKTIIYSLFFLGLFNSGSGQFIQKSAQTEVSFKIKNLGINVEGKFTDVLFENNFKKNDLNNSFINVTIKVNSLDTGNKKRDDHLMKEIFFDVVKFQEITFRSTKIEEIEENNYNLKGSLRIKNTTRIINIPIKITDNSSILIFNSNFELLRRDYKVGGRSWVLSNKVKIQVIFSK